MKAKIFQIAKTIFQGLIILFPFVITIRFLLFVVEYFDRFLALNKILGTHIPGVGLFFTLFLAYFVGRFSQNLIGRSLIKAGENLIYSIPFVRGIHKIIKEALATFTSNKKEKFTRAVFLEYPRKGIFTIGFVTGSLSKKFSGHSTSSLINIFIPTTPNPTSGFLVMLPESETIPTPLSIEEAFKLVISGGILNPEFSSPTPPPPSS